MADRGEISDYILGEMDELDRARFERDMQDDERLRSEVESMRLLVGRIDELGGEAWDYVDSREQEPAVPARAPARRPRVPALRLALGFAAAAVVILVLVLALSSGSTKSSSSRTVQLSALAGAPPSARGTARFIGPETVQMRVEHLPATDVAHFYELWLMTDTTHLVSVGKFRVDVADPVDDECLLARVARRLPVSEHLAPARRRRHGHLQRLPAAGSDLAQRLPWLVRSGPR